MKNENILDSAAKSAFNVRKSDGKTFHDISAFQHLVWLEKDWPKTAAKNVTDDMSAFLWNM